ncbi:MAG: alpha-N-arabinofuranosidase [Lachnospiraceae bacterium]|nr:alpha-N-arabinofuranosidase [Lachnospiraceae bacterium]MCR4865359.1 alpha-N-arabinofuranosidase [Lachnospiraceae bacterium]
MIRLTIHENEKKGNISPEIYGHFSEHLGRCIYEGLFVGEDSQIPNKAGMRSDVVEALKDMKLPVLRWPGGCFADEYHWKDGIGPKENRKRMVNTNWGGVVEDNSFGTHEYFELCDQLGCKTYINGNVGSGTVQEMAEWIEYMTFDGESPLANERRKNGHDKPWRVDYFGVGNENWGCGGNMHPEYYADVYRRYQSFVKSYDKDNPINRIACGPSDFDYDWTEKLLNRLFTRCFDHLHGNLEGISLHYYTLPHDWDHKGDAVKFTEDEWYITLNKTLKMDEIITKHSNIMDKYDPKKILALIVDEWGCWFDVEEGTNPGFLYQQNTMRDALVAGINLNIFNKHCDRVRMANIAQTVNVLQSVILTEGKKMVLTPTYHVFRMFKHHQDSQLLNSFLTGVNEAGIDEYKVPEVTESVSMSKDGTVNITLNNLTLDSDKEIDISFDELKAKDIEAFIVTGAMDAHNTFDDAEVVTTKEFKGLEADGKNIKVNLPARSVVLIRVK